MITTTTLRNIFVLAGADFEPNGVDFISDAANYAYN